MGSTSSKVIFPQLCCSGDQFDPAHGVEEFAVVTDASPRLESGPKGSLSDPRMQGIRPSTTVRGLLSEMDEELRRAKLEAKAKSAQHLRLRVVSSSVLPKGTLFNISALGAEESLRKARDGRTYFGCKKRAEKGNKASPVLNDVILPASDPELTERHRGRHFMIEFDPTRDAYFIKDLGNGFGAFAKLDSQLTLRDNNLLHIGESFVVVNLVPGKTQEAEPRLRLKLFGGPNTGEVFYFSVSELVQGRIRVGRNHLCEIPIDDGLISKVQFTVHYEEETGWMLADGDWEQQRPSTNGTWVYLSEEYELYNGMVFKVSSTLIQAMLWI